jgi:4-alpha-glucanotransferase
LQPTVVAGVPPDYFSETGQLWGNPLYNWDAMEADQFEWWVGRMRRAFEQVSIVRLDHFRGFESCWSIPATDKNAVRGQWVKSPGDRLLATIRQAIGDASIIAEDLGVITPEVEALRIRYGFPGMRILQFAFDENETRSDYFLPHNYDADTVAYTGTHDNETVKGWFNNQPQRVRDRVLQYLGGHSDCISWDFIVLAMSSKANTVILPMQDVLGLGNEARFNRPATLGGNWQWRLRPSYLTDSPSERLAKLVQETDRDRMFSIAMQSKPDH